MKNFLKRFKWLLLIGGAAGTAFAAREQTVDLVNSLFPQWFQSGIYVSTAATNAPQSTTNKVVNFLATDFSPWDYPALGTGALNSLNQTCAETDPVTLTGAAIGDNCQVSSNWGMDGGAALPLNAILSCRTTTNGVVGRLCIAYNTDAGTLSLTDAGYRYFTRK